MQLCNGDHERRRRARVSTTCAACTGDDGGASFGASMGAACRSMHCPTFYEGARLTARAAEEAALHAELDDALAGAGVRGWEDGGTHVSQRQK